MGTGSRGLALLPLEIAIAADAIAARLSADYLVISMLATWIHASPTLQQSLSRYMLEMVGITLTLKSPLPPNELQVEAWTNLPTRLNSDGIWYSLDIPYDYTCSDGSYCFRSNLQPTSPGHFGLTYRIRHRANPSFIQWAGDLGENVKIFIAPPAPDMDWTQGASYAEILPGFYVGNFIAASQAEILGFDAVLNMAEELELAFTPDGPVAYHKLSCQDGAHHPIPEAHLQAAIAWIERQRAAGKQRILVHCRAGIGRSGSIGVAYCLHRHRRWTYQQALDYVWSKKPDIYPHRQLQSSLEKLLA